MGQGDLDMMLPIESSRQIKIEYQKMGKENLTYIEYIDWDHGFNGEFEIIFHDIKNWFGEKIQ